MDEIEEWKVGDQVDGWKKEVKAMVQKGELIGEGI